MTRVFVFGNAGMDVCLTLPRLPARGETLVAGAVSRAPGGKGLNQAVVAARAGAAVLFGAAIGDDAEADDIAAVLAREPFAALRLARLGQRTDQSIVMVGPDGENCIVTMGACADALDPDAAEAFVAEMASGDWLVLQGNLPLPTTRAAAHAAVERGGQVLLNAAPLRWKLDGLLGLCAVVVANAVEAAEITGLAGEAAVARLLALGAGRAVVTLGEAGCAVGDASGVATLAGRAVRAIDSTGAGDTFCGMLVARLAAGRDWLDAIDAAQRAASVAVTRPGAYAALPSAGELAGGGVGALGDAPSR